MSSVSCATATAGGRRPRGYHRKTGESLLEKPIEDVRARLNLGMPPVYTPVRSDNLRARGIIG